MDLTELREKHPDICFEEVRYHNVVYPGRYVMHHEENGEVVERLVSIASLDEIINTNYNDDKEARAVDGEIYAYVDDDMIAASQDALEAYMNKYYD